MGIKEDEEDTGPSGLRGNAGNWGPQGKICIYYTNVMCGNCMYALLGDPGYPGPPWLRG